MGNTTHNDYDIQTVDDIHWDFAWQQVLTFVVTKRGAAPRIIYVWVKDVYIIAFTKIEHFLEYMGLRNLSEHAELERFDFEDVFDYDGPEDPFSDFLIAVVEGRYEEWDKSAYDGKYPLKSSS